MPLFPSAGSSQHPLTSTLKSNLESGLVFSHPVLYLAWYWILDTPQEKVNRKPRFLSEHEVERRLACALVRSCVVTEKHLWQTDGPIPFLENWKGTKELMKSSVKLLALIITHRVVQSDTGLFATPYKRQSW